ncbi:MAG: serine hydrolase [Patescibacteria group bacterium]
MKLRNRGYIIIIIVLLLSNFTTLYVSSHYRKSFEATSLTNPYPFIDFSRSFIEQKYFIVNLKPLREYAVNLLSSYPDASISVYIEFLNTGSNISLNPEMRVNPASLTKVPVAMMYMKKIEEGVLAMDTEFNLTEEDRDSGWGDLYKSKPGATFTLDELLQQSLINSDNTAHNILYKNLSLNDVTQFGDTLGLEELFNEAGEISAKEYSRLFRALYTSSYLNRESSQQMLFWLSKSPYDEYLNSGLSSDVVFAHKFGEKNQEGLYLDSGIVYVPNKPYLITVFVADTTDTGRASALNFMEKLSSEAYNYLNF